LRRVVLLTWEEGHWKGKGREKVGATFKIGLM